MALNAHPDRPGAGPGDGMGGEGESDETGVELLPCGRELGAVWEAWDERNVRYDWRGAHGVQDAYGARDTLGAQETHGVRGSRGAPDDADPHLTECPYCSAALADLATLGEAVDRTRGAGPPAAAEVSDLTSRVMDIVRLELRPGRPLALGEADDDMWIVEAAAARAFRAAAETLPGVRAGSCRISPRERGPVSVRLEVAAGVHLNLPELAEEIRTRIADSARDAIGIEVESIDVLVVDLFEDDEGEDNDGDDGADGTDGAGGEGR